MLLPVPHGSSQSSVPGATVAVASWTVVVAPVVGEASIVDGSTLSIASSRRIDEIKLAAKTAAPCKAHVDN